MIGVLPVYRAQSGLRLLLIRVCAPYYHEIGPAGMIAVERVLAWGMEKGSSGKER
jgi:hypothetical protein